MVFRRKEIAGSRDPAEILSTLLVPTERRMPDNEWNDKIVTSQI
jgi:hypothetical protein